MRRLTTDQGLELLGALINSISDRARVSKKRKKLSTLELLTQVARDPVTCDINHPLAYLSRLPSCSLSCLKPLERGLVSIFFIRSVKIQVH